MRVRAVQVVLQIIRVYGNALGLCHDGRHRMEKNTVILDNSRDGNNRKLFMNKL